MVAEVTLFKTREEFCILCRRTSLLVREVLFKHLKTIYILTRAFKPLCMSWIQVCTSGIFLFTECFSRQLRFFEVVYQLFLDPCCFPLGQNEPDSPFVELRLGDVEAAESSLLAQFLLDSHVREAEYQRQALQSKREQDH